MRYIKRKAPKFKRLALITLIVTVAATFVPSVSQRAQRTKDSSSNVAGITTRRVDGGAVVTVAGDGPLNRTQTWQDEEGFHVSLPGAGKSDLKSVPRGVKVRRIADSLEIVVPTTPGSNVTVQPRFNRLDLVVNGGIDSSRKLQDDLKPEEMPKARGGGESAGEDYSPRPSRERRNFNLPSAQSASSLPEAKIIERATNQPSGLLPSAATQTPAASDATKPNAPVAAASPASQTEGPKKLIPSEEESIAKPTPAQSGDGQQSQIIVANNEGGLLSSIFSTTGIILILAFGVTALFLVRRSRAASEEEEIVFEEPKEKKKAAAATVAETKSETTAVAANVEEPHPNRVERRREGGRRKSDHEAQQKNIVPQLIEANGNGHGHLEARAQTAPVMPALFGAYRVDQEVGKLVLGQPHRMDVLASRAPDDRRAIEASLLKVLQSTEADEDGQRRARRALEEYGFVARLSAALLLAPDAYERVSAARLLGEIKASCALPFLLEALYDSDLTVRTYAVSSLGELRMPAAIGALLDMARRHPEMPATLLSHALSACSLETFTGFDLNLPEMPAHTSHMLEPFTGEITRLDPVATVEELPEWLEDEHLSEALERLEHTDVEARAAAVRQLAQYQVQCSVKALRAIAASDPDSSVRAAAINSLGLIGHESVFAPVLIALSDEAREVRAAAARALSRLSFDRADAYVRLMETADVDTIVSVAHACVKAGMAAQAVDRLASEDRRHAYEAFSLLSLLAKANETEPILEAIGSHSDLNVRLAATRLLGMAGQPEVAQKLRQVAISDGIPEKVRTAILEVVYKIDQAQPV